MPVYAPINPKTLKWARETAGYNDLSELAISLKIEEVELKEWESGKTPLTIGKAKKLANKYNVSLPVLYLDEIPEEFNFNPPHDFRRLANDNIKPKLRWAITTAQDRQQWASEILKSEDKKFKRPEVFNPQGGSKNLALKIRQWLGLPTNPKVPEKWLDEWIAKAEDKGVLVMQTNTHFYRKIAGNEFSGCLLNDDYAPVILLNGSDSPARRLFTLFHELAHLWLNKPGISYVNDESIKTPSERIEKFCNEVAAQILIPREKLAECWQNFSGDIDEKIKEIRKETGASYAAIAVNLSKHGFISDEQYRQERERQEREFIKHKKGGGHIIPHKQTLKQCGHQFSSLVLSGYEQNWINGREMNNLLGMKLNHVGKLANELNMNLYGWS